MFIPVLEHSFYLKIFLMSLGVVDLQMTHMIVCWKSLYVYLLVLKSQPLLFSGFGVLRPEVEAVHRESEAEQRTLGFLFKGFRPLNEVIRFQKIP